MKNRLYILTILFTFTFVIILFLLQSNSITTMKYFPIDKEASFSEVQTNLSLDNAGNLDWNLSSSTEQQMYLRQDVSLLYENGLFKGVQSKWRQNEKDITMTQRVPLHQTSLFETISFHHGEIHPQSKNNITSIQTMTAAQLQIKKANNDMYEQLSDNQKALELQKHRDRILQQKWQELIAYFQLNKENYYSIPFTELVAYNIDPLPSIPNEDQSKQIIGQLWEGIYKNYIVRLKEEENKIAPHPMPLILVSKDHTHLLFLFELNDHKEMLRQQLSLDQ